MKSENTTLVQQLTNITKDLRFPSEASQGFEAFVYEVYGNEELTLEKLMLLEGFLFPVTANDFIEFVSSEASWVTCDPSVSSLMPLEVSNEMSLKYSELIKFLISNFKTLEIFLIRNLGYANQEMRKESLKKSKIGDPSLFLLPLVDFRESNQLCIEQEAFHILIGETFDNDYVAIAPKLDGSRDSKGARSRPPDCSHNKKTVKLKNSILELTRDLEFSVIQNLSFDRIREVIIETASTKEFVFLRLLDELDFLKISTFEKYSVLFDEIEKFQDLDNFLESRLTDVKDYTIGLNAVFYIYTIGRSSEGDWVGVSTSATWT